MAHSAGVAHLRNWAEVNELAKRLDPSTFGRVCQCLLALAFRESGYTISHFQYVGRPDFVAEKGQIGYSVEAKAPVTDRVNIKNEDLKGVEGLGHKPVVVVLTYPDLSTKWLVVDAAKLSARAYLKQSLERLGNVAVGGEISREFFKVISKHRAEIDSGSFESLKDAVAPPANRKSEAEETRET